MHANLLFCFAFCANVSGSFGKVRLGIDLNLGRSSSEIIASPQVAAGGLEADHPGGGSPKPSRASWCPWVPQVDVIVFNAAISSMEGRQELFPHGYEPKIKAPGARDLDKFGVGINM